MIFHYKFLQKGERDTIADLINLIFHSHILLQDRKQRPIRKIIGDFVSEGRPTDDINFLTEHLFLYSLSAILFNKSDRKYCFLMFL